MNVESIDKNGKNKNPLPTMINLKYGERNKKIFRLVKIKNQDFIYSYIIDLIQAYKPVKNNMKICMIVQKPGGNNGAIIQNEKDFTNLVYNESLFSYMDKASLKIEFFYKAASPENLKNKQNSELLDKFFQEMSSDSNSKLVLDFILDYITKQRDFPDMLFEHLKEKLVIKEDLILSKEDFSTDIVPGLITNIKENYETLVLTRTNLGNLNLNISFNKATISTSFDESENKKDIKRFSELYKPHEIEDFSSQIVRDTLSSIQIRY